MPSIQFYLQKDLLNLVKDSSKAEQASELMKFTSKELFEEGIVDKIILEKNRSFKKIATELQTSLLASLKEWRTKSKEELVSQRLEKFRKFLNECRTTYDIFVVVVFVYLKNI